MFAQLRFKSSSFPETCNSLANTETAHSPYAISSGSTDAWIKYEPLSQPCICCVDNFASFIPTSDEEQGQRLSFGDI